MPPSLIQSGLGSNRTSHCDRMFGNNSAISGFGAQPYPQTYRLNLPSLDLHSVTAPLPSERLAQDIPSDRLTSLNPGSKRKSEKDNEVVSRKIMSSSLSSASSFSSSLSSSSSSSNLGSIDFFRLNLESLDAPLPQPERLPITYISDTHDEDRKLLRWRVDDKGNTELHLRIRSKDTDGATAIIKRATEFGDVNIPNNASQTPLHLAVLHRQGAVLRQLMVAGALVAIKDSKGNTPLHLACYLGYKDLVKDLIRGIRYSEAKEIKYQTPFFAVPQDLTIKNQAGFTCRDLALDKDHSAVVEMLDDL